MAAKGSQTRGLIGLVGPRSRRPARMPGRMTAIVAVLPQEEQATRADAGARLSKRKVVRYADRPCVGRVDVPGASFTGEYIMRIGLSRLIGALSLAMLPIQASAQSTFHVKEFDFSKG